ncbi:MAG: Hint domain-containing protein [Cyanobacteria bacterium SBLK]|nr:Hint domain-containing protein [Cyanobacteria bacterium SBLK]
MEVFGSINPENTEQTKAKVEQGWGKGQIPCFPQGTIVSTPNGNRPIEKLKIGDEVYAYNFESNSIIVRKILSSDRGSTNSWIAIVLSNSMILRVTQKHPIWVASESKWIEAEHLKLEMSLYCQDGQTVNIENIQIQPERFSQETYNLTVEAVNNFFVGKSHILDRKKRQILQRKQTISYE